MTGTLYLLPTRLGESPHWPAVLPNDTCATACRLQRFIVENAKTARSALKWMNHPTPLREIAIEQLPEPLTPPIIDHLLAPLKTGTDTGLMSDAGCPGVADPGALLVRRAHATGIPIKPLVGPSSLLLALMASGLDGQRFAFHGYLPSREPERSRRIVEARWLTEEGEGATLHDLAAEFGVSAERIRQIEVKALQKMRGVLTAA